MAKSTEAPVGSKVDKEHLAIVVDIWKYSVGVQMHFNDMGMKIRNLYFTILAAAMGLIGVVQGKSVEMHYPAINIHLALFVLIAIIPISMLFYFLDAHWYHRLLIGAVKQCNWIETKYKDVLPEIQLGAAISKESPVKFDRHWRWLLWFVADMRFRNKTNLNLHSNAKIEVLYKSVIWGVVGILVLYILFGAIEFEECTIFALLFDPSCHQQ
jgi:hypothetical protein